MNFMGMGVEQNPNKGKGLTIELVKKIDLTETEKDSFNIELLCGGVNYNFVINDYISNIYQICINFLLTYFI